MYITIQSTLPVRVIRRLFRGRKSRMVEERVVATVEHLFTWSQSQLEERKTGISSKVEHEQIEVIEAKGIRGDRYATGKGTYSKLLLRACNMTLFDVTQFEEICAKPRLRHANLDISSLRRNVGLRCKPASNIHSWLGHEIRIGSAVFFVHMHGNPCSILEKTLKAAGLLDCAWDHCGVHAEVITSGVISKGDNVIICGPPHPDRVFNLERPLETYLRPALRSKLKPDLTMKADTVDGGYVTAIHYYDKSGYLGSWARQDEYGRKAGGGRAVARGATAISDCAPSLLASLAAGIAVAAAALQGGWAL